METKIKTSGGSQFLVDGLTHYERNKTIYIEKNKRRRAKNKKYIENIKESRSCADCGSKYPCYVMDFDHLPGSGKIANLSSPMAWSWGREKIDAEIAKCELVCSNCHRIRTYRRASIV